VQLNGVTGDFASATQTAAFYIGAYGMDGTLSSFLAFSNGLGGINPTAIPNFAERVENVLQTQLKVVKQLFQEHSEAVIAVAEALIDREELVADEIKQLITEADARQVARKVISEFAPLLGAPAEQALPEGRGAISPPRVVESTLNSERNNFKSSQGKDGPSAQGDEPYKL